MESYCATYCRSRLTETMIEVRKHVPVQERKKAWVWRDGHWHVEFHGPNGYYWYGSGCCCYDARIRGWEAYLGHIGIEGYRWDD